MGEKSVKIYTLSTCGHCKATKKLLSECEVEFDFTDVDLLEGDERAAVLEEVRKINERCSFPTIVINNRESILGLLRRRPCTLDDIAGGLGMHRNEVAKYLEELSVRRLLLETQTEGRLHYQAIQ